MDLALVLDGSDSVGNADFEKLKNWSKSFIENLQVDKYGAQVGVIKYATSIKDVSPMSSDIEDIKVSLPNRKCYTVVCYHREGVALWSVTASTWRNQIIDFSDVLIE